MNRIKIIQTCLDQTKGETYLEIGAAFGACITQIRAVRKIAVDPKIRMPWPIRKLCERRSKETWYFETTSDEFFKNNDKFLAQTGISVVFVDGLHTYETACRKSVVSYVCDFVSRPITDITDRAYPAGKEE